MAEFKLPTEVVELPSKGLIYPEDNPLSSGKVEMKYMTAKEEDILTNQSYIQKGTVLDKLMESLIISDVNYRDMIVGDRNAIMVAARVLGYGKEYSFTYAGEEHTVDLSVLDNVELKADLFKQGKNEFEFVSPASETKLTFKFLTGHDETKIQEELQGLSKLNSETVPEISTRLKYIITSVEGNREAKDIRNFVDNYLLARDSRALRQYITDIQPDVDLTFKLNSGQEVAIPIGLNFFWPDL
jgi:hypothetical protein